MMLMVMALMIRMRMRMRLMMRTRMRIMMMRAWMRTKRAKRMMKNFIFFDVLICDEMSET